MEEPHLHKLFIGKVQRVGKENAENPLERQWETGIFKGETKGPIWLNKTGFIGDEVGDKKNHGGMEKAVFCYPIKHYTYWQEKYDHEDLVMGGMGENFAVLEMDEFSVCIGDTYKVGDAVIQVSQPRQPCWRPARRFQILDLALQIQNTGRTGWYFRVLEEGNVKADSPIDLVERPYPQWTVQAANEVMHFYKDDLRLADELASCELLAKNWVKRLRKRLRGQESGIDRRVFGPNKE
ncbi:MOSC domain-containing protein [Oceanobacillus sp. HCA-5259]|uniref:MOSC domain-containing protein n=1 Tax=Oceanobacillus sp. HCA-5259 TaxID=3134661 RepID=UPI0030C4A162